MMNRHKEIPKGDQIEIARRENGGRRCVDSGEGDAAGDRPRDQRRDDHGGIFQVGSKNLFVGLYFHTKLLGQHNAQRLIAGHHAGNDGCQQYAAKGRDLFRQGGQPMGKLMQQACLFKDTGIGRGEADDAKGCFHRENPAAGDQGR